MNQTYPTLSGKWPRIWPDGEELLVEWGPAVLVHQTNPIKALWNIFWFRLGPEGLRLRRPFYLG